jgi:hypothetical protein
MGARKPGLQGERAISVKTIAQGGPGCFAPKALRIEILASRALDDLNALPPLWRALTTRPADPLAAGWHMFDRAVASSFDPVNLNYLRNIEQARSLGGGRSAALATACDLWAAAYQFHCSDFVNAARLQKSALLGLAKTYGMLRSLPVALRLAYLEWHMGREAQALNRLEQLAKRATICFELQICDEANFIRYLLLKRRNAKTGAPDFISRSAPSFQKIIAQFAKLDPESVSACDPIEARLFAEVAVTALCEPRPRSELLRWWKALSGIADRLAPEDRLRLAPWLLRSADISKAT